MRWLADWVELSDAAGGKTCCCEKWHCFHGKRSASLSQLRVLFSMFMWCCCSSHLLHSPATWWHVFPCLQLVTCFPALVTGYMFSRTFNWLHVFTCLQLVTFFLALATGYMFSRACNWLHVFPCLLLVMRFSALSELVTWGNALTVFDAEISNNSFTPQSYLLDWFLFFSQIPMNHSWLIVLSLRPWIIAGTEIYSCKEDDTEKINIIVGCC